MRFAIEFGNLQQNLMKKVVKTGKKGDDDKRENGLKEYLKCEFIRINADGDDSDMFIYIYF